MIDIEQSFQEILTKYGYTGMKEDFRRNVYREIRNILHDVCEAGEKVAIKCAGDHTAVLLNDFFDVIEVDYILDKNPDNANEKVKSFQIPIISTHVGHEIDKVIISSFELRQECVEEFRKEGDIEVIDIYEKLEERGLHLTKAYYRYLDDPYRAVVECQHQYRTSVEDKPALLKQLIGCYLDIRDICSALNFIDEYIENQYPEWKAVQALKEDLNCLVDDIKAACRNRPQKDILWFWQDALPYEYGKSMERLCEAAKKGMVFEEAYSPSWTTRSVYARILDQKEEFEIYTDIENRPKSHIAIEYLKKAGYDCYKITCMGLEDIPLDTFNLYSAYDLMQYCTTPELWWEGLRKILSSEKPVFLLLHTGVETHPPMVSPALKEYKKRLLEDYGTVYAGHRIQDSQELYQKNSSYVDQELSFLLELLGKDKIKIFMSDHGNITKKRVQAYSKDALHIVFTVLGSGIPARSYCKLFSVTQFLQLLIFLLEPSEEHEKAMFSEEIWLNAVDLYSLEVIKKYIEYGMIETGIAYCGILTLADRYVRLGTGEEFYHIFPDEQTNHIAEPNYQERIQILREHAGDRFIDIRKNSKFRYSHLVYEALGKKYIYEEKNYEMDKKRP